ncbi:hypothetical protein [Massilia aerilata]|uniref:Transposase n=1 Tax=Massilia aerilata TaxID=453817 RepID=A0ABW0S4P1_9BURK
MVVAERWYPSSKTCSCCGYKLETLALDMRENGPTSRTLPLDAGGADGARPRPAGREIACKRFPSSPKLSYLPAEGTPQGRPACT